MLLMHYFLTVLIVSKNMSYRFQLVQYITALFTSEYKSSHFKMFAESLSSYNAELNHSACNLIKMISGTTFFSEHFD